MKDYYKILGVQFGADADEIKKSFHKLAHLYHPDKPTGNAAKFKEASEAYNALIKNAPAASSSQTVNGFSRSESANFTSGASDVFSQFIRKQQEVHRRQAENRAKEEKFRDMYLNKLKMGVKITPEDLRSMFYGSSSNAV